MYFELQPVLENRLVTLRPLESGDFDELYAAASDPLIWQQHPQNDRYRKEVFLKFFEGAINSGGALVIKNSETEELIGSSRFYDYDPGRNIVTIGYTFLKRSYWGGAYNRAVKKLMLDHAFRFVDKVLFFIGPDNLRSQKAITKIGAVKLDAGELPLYSDQKTSGLVYLLSTENWFLHGDTVALKG